MPELPEVETVKNVLSGIVKNRKILKIDIYRDKTIEGDSKKFAKELVGETFLSMSRRGKYLIFHLTNDKVIISHLRMEGKYYEFLENEPDSKYAKVVFHLDNGHKLCFDDMRCFGTLELSSEDKYMSLPGLAKLGPEPFEIDDVSDLYKKAKRISKPIKTALLDQTLTTGLGNIYVDEVLYASNIHPLTSASHLSKDDWSRVIRNSKEILKIAIEMGGSTIKSYHPGKDIDGNFQTRIKIYGKDGETCPICGATYRFIKVGGRGTTFCPVCQRRYAKSLSVGVTGKIGSGKSEILEEFNAKGYSIISSDQIVKELYQKEEVASKIEKLLRIKFPGSTVDHKVLTEHLLVNPGDKKKLERLIHPMVRRDVESFLKKDKSPLKVVEVPLLFEAHFDDLFDVIIVSEIDDNTQLARLKSRNPSNYMYLLEINKTNKIDQNKKKATYIINNTGDLSNLKKQVNKIIKDLKDYLS